MNLTELNTYDKEFFGYSVLDDFENNEEPVDYNTFCQRAEDYGIEDETFEEPDSRSTDRLIKRYYREYKECFERISQQKLG